MEGYPVQEDQGGQMESVLVKLQLELQQQLQPASGSHQDTTEQQLLVARLTPADSTTAAAAAVEGAGCSSGGGGGASVNTPSDSMHSEITLRQSSGSVGSLAAADPAAAADDASTADAVTDAMSHSIASLAPTPEENASSAPVVAAAAAAADAAADDHTPAAAADGDDNVDDATAAAAHQQVTLPEDTLVTPSGGGDVAAAATSASPLLTPSASLSPLLSPSRAASDRCLSGTEDEWHLVSRGSSVKAASSTGRYSFEIDTSTDAAGAGAAAVRDAAAAAVVGTPIAASSVGDAGAGAGAGVGGVHMAASASGSMSPFHATDGGLADLTDADMSECGSDVTPRDELAASILGHPVMMAAAAAAAAVADAADSSTTAAGAGGGDVAAAAGAAADGSSSSSAEAAEEAVPVLDAQEAIGLLSGGLLQLAGGLREWIVESLAALVQTGRDSQAACMSRASAALRALQLSAKQSGGSLAAAAAAAAGDWRLLLSSAAAVVCLALWMKSRKEANLLRTMLRRRDHELSKLVMRVVSLQELINQGAHLQHTTSSISRYTRFEGAAVTTATTYM